MFTLILLSMSTLSGIVRRLTSFASVSWTCECPFALRIPSPLKAQMFGGEQKTVSAKKKAIKFLPWQLLEKERHLQSLNKI